LSRDPRGHISLNQVTASERAQNQSKCYPICLPKPLSWLPHPGYFVKSSFAFMFTLYLNRVVTYTEAVSSVTFLSQITCALTVSYRSPGSPPSPSSASPTRTQWILKEYKEQRAPAVFFELHCLHLPPYVLMCAVVAYRPPRKGMATAQNHQIHTCTTSLLFQCEGGYRLDVTQSIWLNDMILLG
jgi:hypothetical protein